MRCRRGARCSRPSPPKTAVVRFSPASGEAECRRPCAGSRSRRGSTSSAASGRGCRPAVPWLRSCGLATCEAASASAGSAPARAALVGDLGERGERTDAQASSGVSRDAAKRRDAAQADDRRRREDAVAQAAEQVGPAGVDARVAPGQVTSAASSRLVGRTYEKLGSMATSPPCARPAAAPSASGLIGVSVTRMPVAWKTAFAIAARRRDRGRLADALRAGAVELRVVRVDGQAGEVGRHVLGRRDLVVVPVRVRHLARCCGRAPGPRSSRSRSPIVIPPNTWLL